MLAIAGAFRMPQHVPFYFLFSSLNYVSSKQALGQLNHCHAHGPDLFNHSLLYFVQLILCTARGHYSILIVWNIIFNSVFFTDLFLKMHLGLCMDCQRMSWPFHQCPVMAIIGLLFIAGSCPPHHFWNSSCSQGTSDLSLFAYYF